MPSRPLQRLALSVYRITLSTAYSLGALLFLPVLLLIAKRRKTLFKRFGWQAYPRAENHDTGAVWIHTLSIGELLSAANLIKRTHTALKGRPLYLSVSTLSGWMLAREKLGSHVDGLFFFPYDVGYAVRTCLDHIQPRLFVLVETDIWPGFLDELRRRDIPAMLVNGRLSPQSLPQYRRLRHLFEPAFNTFCKVYPQSQGEAERFLALGLHPQKVQPCGNLKFDVADSLPSAGTVQSLRDSLGLDSTSPVFLAGSTHPGEEVIIRSIFLALKSDHPNLTLILAPRHPERSAELVNLFRGDPFEVRTVSEPRQRKGPVLIVDTMGYLTRLYGLADVAFVGGSMVPKGGQNPIEPASFGKPVLFGPDMDDFPDVSRWLVEAGGAIQVRDEEMLLTESRRLFADHQLARTMGQNAARVVEQNRGTTDRIVRDILTFVDSAPDAVRSPARP